MILFIPVREKYAVRNRMVVPASRTLIVLSGLSISASINRVSRADERLLTTDWLPERAFRIRARLLMLLEEGSSVAVPDITGVRETVIDEVKTRLEFIL